MRNPLDKKTTIDLTKLVVFIVVTTLATGLLVITIGNISFRSTSEYKAVFSDVTGSNVGDDVRIAGVKVGTVQDIAIVNQTQAELTIAVQDDTTLPESSTATIRYRNLVGQRYVALSEGIGSTESMKPGETIPISQTSPALDLTVLFNGFKPLFTALSPEDLNRLSAEVIAVFQGEGGTVESLLASTASVTSTLADRDQLIGQLIDNLDFVLDHLADRDDQLSALIINFRDLVTGLKNDRQAILGSLDNISDLGETTADLADDIREPFVEDISQLRRLTNNINDNKQELDRALQVLPIKANKVGRTAIYGSFFNFYLCNLSIEVKLPPALEALPIGDPELTVPPNQAPRCDLGAEVGGDTR